MTKKNVNQMSVLIKERLELVLSDEMLDVACDKAITEVAEKMKG